jgi:hypothetical protein
MIKANNLYFLDDYMLKPQSSNLGVVQCDLNKVQIFIENEKNMYEE